MVLDRISEECDVSFQHDGESLVGFGMVANENVVLAKPQTFMNASGDAVATLFADYQLSTSDMVVIHDDLDFDIGRLKIQHGAGHGGHRGVESIVTQRMDDQFTRVRVGVGRPPTHMTSADYVLAPLTERDHLDLKDATQRAADAVRCLVSDGLTKAMNRFNSRKTELSITQ